jgi:hypothetical protein
MFDGIEVWGIGWQEEQFTASRLDQQSGTFGLVKAGVVQDNHAALRQGRQQDLAEISINQSGIAGALEDQRSDQFAVLGGSDDAGSVMFGATDFLIDLGAVLAKNALIAV